MPDHTRRPMHSLPPAQQAGILCNDPQFQRFAALRAGLPTTQCTANAAAQYLRDVCHVTSRAQLNHTNTARFAALRTEFDAWAGRIASQNH
ncbi:hypothetical protein O4H61_03470 [Roseovarius aestuarii]|nr:hypothetical protein [Roseovarius aestuarii]